MPTCLRTKSATQSGLCDDATVAVLISEVNDVPDATDDQLAGLVEDAQPLVIQADVLLSDDSAGPGESSQALSLVAVSLPVGGTVQLDDDTITFHPTADYNGPAQFVYRIEDNGTTNAELDPQSDTGTVSFFISEHNDPPVATADTLAPAPEDTPVLLFPLSSLTSNDSTGPTNESDQILTITSVSDVVGGSAVIQDGNIAFSPAPDFNGNAGFTYTVFDNGRTAGSGDPQSDTALASVVITEKNDPPIAGDDVLADVEEDSETIIIPIESLLLNDSPGPDDESGQPLTLLNLPMSVNGVAEQVGDNIHFTINPDFAGVASFDYRVGDNGTTAGEADPLSSVATVSITVSEINDPPIAQNDRLGDQSAGTTIIIEAADLLRNDRPGPDTEHEQALAIVAIAADPGSNAELSNGIVTLDIDESFIGETGFSYTVQDSGNTGGASDPLSDTASVTLTVVAGNLLPLARADVLTVIQGGSVNRLDSLSMSLAANDEDPNGDLLSIVEVPVTQPAAGTVTLSTSGAFEYVHAGGPLASDFFDYAICEQARPTACATARVAVLVVDEAFPTCTAAGLRAISGFEVAIPYQQAFPGTALSYSASGLPPSLVLDESSGLISGVPSSQDAANSPFAVSVIGSHADGDQIVRPFTLTIESEPDTLFYAGNERTCGLQ